MPIFSIIFLFIIAIIFIRYRTSENRFYALFALTVILQIHFFQGYFIKIGANEIWSCESLSLKILAFYSLWLIFSGRARLGRNIYRGVMLCLLFLLGSIAYETFVPFDGLLMPHMEGNTDGGYSWDNLVAGKVAMVGYQPSLQELVGASKTFLYYILVLATFKAFFNLEFFTRSLMSVIKWGKLCIYYGLFEFFLKNAVGQLTFTYDLAGALFGVNRAAIFTEAFSKGGTFYSLQGFTREPSHYVMYLFTIALFMVLAGVCQKRCLEIGVYIKKTFYPFEIILSVLVMFLCGGFSTVWLTCLLLVATVIVYIHSRHLSLLQWYGLSAPTSPSTTSAAPSAASSSPCHCVYSGGYAGCNDKGADIPAETCYNRNVWFAGGKLYVCIENLLSVAVAAGRDPAPAVGAGMVYVPPAAAGAVVSAGRVRRALCPVAAPGRVAACGAAGAGNPAAG